MQRAPSALEPGPDGSRPLCYTRLVQPVLDAHCVRCHDGTAGPDRSSPDLTGPPQQNFTRSYVNLKPYLAWYAWGTGGHVTRPGQIGADLSRLGSILGDERHAAIGLDDAARRRLYLWLDANVPFYGTYDVEEMAAQRAGKTIGPPALE